jgi:subtilisin
MQYVVMPREGFRSEAMTELAPIDREEFPYTVREAELAGRRNVTVLRSVLPDGPKAIEVDDATRAAIEARGLARLAEVVTYVRPFSRSRTRGNIVCSSYPLSQLTPKVTKAPAEEVVIRVREVINGQKVVPEHALLITALSNVDTNVGEQKVTNSDGEVSVRVWGDTIKRLYCPYLWKWGGFRESIPLPVAHGGIRRYDLDLPPLDHDFVDCVRARYGNSRFEEHSQVTVGVIDTGVGPHSSLNIVDGYNVIGGNKDYADIFGHGTFVAGLIGGKGGGNFSHVRGLAPNVRIIAYRIFGAISNKTMNDLIAGAIGQAVVNGCDIINLSLENDEESEAHPETDVVVRDAITDALDRGRIIIAAAGNDNRQDVDYPAAFPGVIAVSAMGIEGKLPPNVLEHITVCQPPQLTGQGEFIAGFSNKGGKIEVTAPGVGVMSLLPKEKWGVCSGTSFAAPVVAGAAACLLSQRPDLVQASRDRARSDAIRDLLFASCTPRGFGPEYEGRGLPDPGER